jgi:hypothetical protein
VDMECARVGHRSETHPSRWAPIWKNRQGSHCEFSRGGETKTKYGSAIKIFERERLKRVSAKRNDLNEWM